MQPYPSCLLEAESQDNHRHMRTKIPNKRTTQSYSNNKDNMLQIISAINIVVAVFLNIIHLYTLLVGNTHTHFSSKTCFLIFILVLSSNHKYNRPSHLLSIQRVIQSHFKIIHPDMCPMVKFIFLPLVSKFTTSSFLFLFQFYSQHNLDIIVYHFPVQR